MHHARFAAAVPAVCLLVSSVLPAQLKSWVVDDDFPLPADADFGSIQQAVDAASEFDLILVRSGNYEAFSIFGKSLTVQADGDVIVMPPFLQPLPSLNVGSLGPGQSVSVRGLDLTNGLAFLGTSPAVTLSNNAGTVLLEDCKIESLQGPALLVAQCESAVLERCDVTSLGTRYDDFLGIYLAGAGLDVANANLDLIDSLVQGGHGADAFSGPFWIFYPNGFGDPGLRFGGSAHALRIVGSEIRGGDGGDNVPGLCLAGEAGGDGLQLNGAAGVRLLDSALHAGSGGAGLVPCSPGDGDDGLPPTPAGFPVVNLTGGARTVELEPLALSGTTATAAYSGEAGDQVLLLFSNLAQQAVWYDVPGAALYLPLSSIVVPLGGLDASGTGSFDVPVGRFGSVLEYARVFVQGVFLPQSGGLYTSGPSRSVWLSQLVFGP